MARTRPKKRQRRSSRRFNQKSMAGGSVPSSRSDADEFAQKTRMSPRAKALIYGLMGVLLVFFVIISWLAPDPSQPDGRPSWHTVLVRLLFLLVPLAVMYALMVWDNIVDILKRRS